MVILNKSPPLPTVLSLKKLGVALIVPGKLQLIFSTQGIVTAIFPCRAWSDQTNHVTDNYLLKGKSNFSVSNRNRMV